MTTSTSTHLSEPPRVNKVASPGSYRVMGIGVVDVWVHDTYTYIIVALTGREGAGINLPTLSLYIHYTILHYIQAVTFCFYAMAMHLSIQ